MIRKGGPPGAGQAGLQMAPIFRGQALHWACLPCWHHGYIHSITGPCAVRDQSEFPGAVPVRRPGAGLDPAVLRCAPASGNGGWTAAYRFWVRIFALSFVLTLAASAGADPAWQPVGRPDGQDRQCGRPLLGYGILSVFILKSCFLGVMLFGQRRVRRARLAVLMVAVGQLVAVFWVLALQSWMQTPDGALLVDGRYQVYDWAAVVFNPSIGWRMAQVALGSAGGRVSHHRRDGAAGAAPAAGRRRALRLQGRAGHRRAACCCKGRAGGGAVMAASRPRPPPPGLQAAPGSTWCCSPGRTRCRTRIRPNWPSPMRRPLAASQ